MENSRIMNEALIYYYKLQYIRFTRKCKELQVLPFLVIGFLVVIFVATSSFIFYKTDLANWIYPCIALTLVMQLTNSSNENFRIFSTLDLRKMRLVQGMSIAIPFMAFLLYKQLWLQIIILLFLSILCSLITFRSRSSFRIPTPFRSWPFEFIVGFRKSILIVAILYFLILKGIQVGNVNLAYACMGFIFLLSMSFYALPEQEIFVWINNKSPKKFLLKKLGVAILCSTLMALPALIVSLTFFPDHYLAAVFIFIGGYSFITTMVLAKYAAFPKELSLPMALILGVSFLFPPLLIYTIPSFYKKACRQVQPILEC